MSHGRASESEFLVEVLKYMEDLKASGLVGSVKYVQLARRFNQRCRRLFGVPLIDLLEKDPHFVTVLDRGSYLVSLRQVFVERSKEEQAALDAENTEIQALLDQQARERKDLFGL